MKGAELASQVARETAVRRAMMCFWQRGVEVASYNDIVEATGLSRKALYALWPHKDALVRAAMALYRNEVLGPLIDRLGLGGRAGLEGFWNGIADGVRTPGWAGCFLFRSAGETLHSDQVIAAHFDEHAKLLRTRMSRAVREALAEQSLDQEVDPDAAAWQALAIIALISTYGALSGNSGTVAKLIGVGRTATGLAAVANVALRGRGEPPPRNDL
ncbi:MAG: TetR/AcrR family transcriptional regulator [Devosia sp.]